jgi:hypothetical protein
MKVTALLQRRGRHRSGPAISLFPFLAVLICTMGALVPLLLAIARQARLQAAQEAAAKVAEHQSNVQNEREVVQWRIGQLKISREKTEEQLGDARQTLGHIEDHQRRLAEEVARLQSTWDDLEKLDSLGSRKSAEVEAEIAQVKAELTQAERLLGDARRAAATRQPSYAVVPYHGPNQTRRRPIYIECTTSSLILQPEGVVLEEEDFDGPLGPGNPLAAAIRAAHEYLLTRGGLDPKESGEPYPLLLVRPDGVMAYWAARAALKSWGSEFGYELVNADWKLQFPKPDPELAQVMRKTIDNARFQQQRLIAAAPRTYGGSSRPIYRAAPGGGIMQEPGASKTDNAGYIPGWPAAAFGSNAKGSGGTAGLSGSGLSGAGNMGATAGLPGSGTSGAGGTDGLPGSGGASLEGSSGSVGSTGGSGGTASLPGSGGASLEGSSGSVGSTGGQASRGASPGTTGGSAGQANRIVQPEGVLSINPLRDPVASSKASAGRQGSVALRPGEWYPTEPAPPEKPAEPPDKKKEQNKKPVKSLADSRGKDWGLRDMARGGSPITRSITIDCQRDRLVLVPESGLAGKTVPLGTRTEASMDDFISALWSYMDSWGIAGKGMYWRPVLQVNVAPDAEQRYQDLSRLLEGSGVSVQRKDKG